MWLMSLLALLAFPLLFAFLTSSIFALPEFQAICLAYPSKEAQIIVDTSLWLLLIAITFHLICDNFVDFLMGHLCSSELQC